MRRTPARLLACLAAAVVVAGMASAQTQPLPELTDFLAQDSDLLTSEVSNTALDVLTAALETALLENIRHKSQLDRFQMRDAALGLTALSGSDSVLQERAISLLREVADLREANDKLREFSTQLIETIRHSGMMTLDTSAAIVSLQAHTSSSAQQSPVRSPQSPVTLTIIAQDSREGWFIANAGWESGIIEGMLYRFENSDGSAGRLRVIETRRRVSALVAQVGGVLPAIGQTLTLETR